ARPVGIRNYAIDKLAGDILALADQAGITRFHVLGHDWGAAVAWHLAGNHSAHVMTVSALSVPPIQAFLRALPRGQVVLSWYMGFFQIPKLPEWLVTVGNGWVTRKILGPYADMSNDMIRDTLAMAREPGAITAALNWYRGLRYWLLKKPARIHTPTLFVWSNRDSAVGRTAAHGAGRYVDGPYHFEILDDTSHWIPAERPTETASLVIGHARRYR
ncbi:alpha/beta fold hydrolase, partial [Mycobacteroides abscessus]|nr:alpha/beta fold hydrolase [Mycobacteroides abscessus]MDM2433166.1 alpha/beta fold hydrolase [Mycobacteroides abscessus]MDM2438184.1 alpha/beta fold hydrolase [Mycobacteroides abscessus]